MDLRTGDLLALLEAPELAELRRSFRSHRFARRALVFPMDEGNRVFIVKTGRVRVYLSYGDKEFTLSILQRGDIYSTHTRALVEALEPTELLVAETAALQRKLTEIPAVTLAIVKVLGSMLHSSISVIEALAFKDVRRRLADFLLNAARSGRATERGTIVEHGLTTEELARLLGTTRQTVSTLVNELKRCGIVERVDRRSLLVKTTGDLLGWAGDEEDE